MQGRGTADLAEGSLAAHRQTQHSVGLGIQWETPNPPPTGEPQMYRVSFPRAARPWECPFEGCQRRAATWTGFCVHFVHRHVRDTVMIMGEVNLP